MALEPCHECGLEVSTEADACPHCGAPVTVSAETSTGCGTIAAGVFTGLTGCVIAPVVLGFVLLIALAMCA